MYNCLYIKHDKQGNKKILSKHQVSFTVTDIAVQKELIQRGMKSFFLK